MNTFEAKQAARRVRLLAAAENAQQASQQVFHQTREISSLIPAGQPILVGHHSEKRHRRALAKIDHGFRKSHDLYNKARYYEQKASVVGQGGISSDDPEALVKLRQEWEEATLLQDQMKKANRMAKKNNAAGLADLGFSAKEVQDLLTPQWFGLGFAPYRLTNNQARVRRLAGRIKELETHQGFEDVEIQGHGYTYSEDTTENRVMFEFSGKPEIVVRDLLKRQGFKWSPTRGAWMRLLNDNGISAGNALRRELENLGKRDETG